ncbi:Hypothetical predicted protein [Prunus dulcis]|uniref:Uncharacterized protein n=1 Tax=Prunus dulcis TaxID=3755 RepID=A0A5E4FHR2_PRUDU|nr:hypothetical protein L3X38_013679 [Prunus dulcis]VVA27382.1 Hypothetical predicted protein [Prunus dulcis]
MRCLSKYPQLELVLTTYRSFDLSELEIETNHQIIPSNAGIAYRLQTIAMQFQSGVVNWELDRVCVWEKNRVPIRSCQLGTQRHGDDSIRDLALVCCKTLCKSLSMGYFEVVESKRILKAAQNRFD